MNPITIIYRLKLKGITISQVARDLGESKQLVRAAIYGNPGRGKMRKIRNHIDGIIKD